MFGKVKSLNFSRCCIVEADKLLDPHVKRLGVSDITCDSAKLSLPRDFSLIRIKLVPKDSQCTGPRMELILAIKSRLFLPAPLIGVRPIATNAVMALYAGLAEERRLELFI